MLVAGEASGDLHAANLFRELRSLLPSLKGIGMGGIHMREAGVDLRYDSTGIAVIGAIEVIKHYGEIRRALNLMKQLLRDERPDLLICVDYKEFNFHLAKAAKKLGVKVLFYVSPQFWAWRPGRVKQYGKVVDHMAVIFPFEVPFYETYGIPVTYVGHPLAGSSASGDRATLAAEFGLAPDSPTIGLLPGSRANEIKRLLPVMLKSVTLLAQRFPDAQFVLSQAPSVDDGLLAACLRDMQTSVKVVKGRNRDLVNCCDAVITVSGTATLEVALAGVPMAIIYKVAPLTYWLGRLLINIPFIGLPNILAGRSIVREFIQQDSSAVNIAGEVGRILEQPEYAGAMKSDLQGVAEILGTGDGSAKLARLAVSMLAPRL
ncbi:MAG: lipid-A-disaccharide synthase [Methylococcaceae bacterium]|nr:lipid-A-disaccharide synthase [Methylococcaceae bacterium]